MGRNLASYALTLVERRLPDDWELRYALRPVLPETFREMPRFAETCYRAASKVGATQGRAATPGANALTRSRMLKPLRRDRRRILKKIDCHLTSERLRFGFFRNDSFPDSDAMLSVFFKPR